MTSKLERTLSQRFPDRGDSAGIYEVLARELHPLLKRARDIINEHADDIDALSAAVDDLVVDVAAVVADIVTINTNLALKANKKLTIQTVSTATYTLQASDAGTYIRFTNAAGCAVTVPGNVFAEGEVIHLRSTQAVPVSIVESGSTVSSIGNKNARVQHSSIALVCVTPTTFDEMGDIHS